MVEQPPRLDRHIGIAGFDGRRVKLRARLHAQARDFTQYLAVPLGEFERRYIARHFNRWIIGQHLLQEADPGLADAGLAVWHALEEWCGCRRQGAEHRLSVRQWNAAD